MTHFSRYIGDSHLMAVMKVFLSSNSELISKNGILRIEKVLPDTIVLNGKGEETKIKTNKPQDKMKFYNLILKNGNTLSLGENTLVMTTDGPKKVQDVLPDDYILHRFSSLDSDRGNSPMNWEVIYGANAVPIKVPKKMNKDFALWLGIVASKGRYYETNGYVAVSLNDKVMARLFHELSLKVFKIKPVVYEDRGGYLNHYINSRNLVRFLKTAMGINSNMKKVPQQLMEGSIEEQLAFIKGLTLDGYIEQGALVVYGGISKRLADFSAMVLRNCGYAIYQQVRKSGQGNDVYYTKISGSSNHAVEFYALEEKKTEGVGPHKGGYLVKVTEEILSTKLPSGHPSYSALRNLKQRKSKTCYNYTLKDLEIPFPENDYYVMVKEVKIQSSHAFCIETEDSGLIYHGAVLESKE